MVGGINKKKGFKRFVYSKGVILLLLVLIFFVGKAAFGVYEKHQKTGEALAQTQSAYDELEVRKYDLEEKLKLLNTEKGIEREIRETYGVAKEGEGVIIIVDEEQSEAENTTPTPEESWWKKLIPFI